MLKVDHKPLFRAPILKMSIFFIYDTYNQVLFFLLYIFIAIEQPGYVFDDLTHILSIYRITFYVNFGGKHNLIYHNLLYYHGDLSNDATSVRGKTGRITWLIQKVSEKVAT